MITRLGQVVPLGVIELQRLRERVEHDVGNAGVSSPLESRQVFDADARQSRDLAAAEPGNTTDAADGKADLLRGETPTPGGEESAECVVVGVHVFDPTTGVFT
jgi:hypothetical protein